VTGEGFQSDVVLGFAYIKVQKIDDLGIPLALLLRGCEERNAIGRKIVVRARPRTFTINTGL